MAPQVIDALDLHAARAEALTICREIWGDYPPIVEGGDIAFEITDESGQTVLRVPCSEVLEEMY
jgi:hypothetical protein